ncbi:hypothetical protein [Catenuloplanes atrovinosus]|uniref:Uncharacterized protein n=1 Tax=Catenuloplanes atrovinosus TaxID=137266 RepID=A0AAE4CDV2_9ACTN|nr:hypothetical protein [Catenuloplanes atrovinosus]MDR7277920.1 hypothetical protein [Catenuloplanes atrovinosus]
MITVQRVRVRWSAAARGAPHADLRRGLSAAVPLPVLPPGHEVAVHDVVYDEGTGYRRHDDVRGDGAVQAVELGLWFTTAGTTVIVDRIPGGAAFPRDRGKSRLFALAPGQVGRYRANFRFTFTRCSCDPSWFYEDWLVHVGNGPPGPGWFDRGDPDHHADHRVHLYGGTTSPRSRVRR